MLLTLLISLAFNSVILWLQVWVGGRQIATGLMVVILFGLIALTG
jgi:hypothetical protein